jgi:hypothetical protein
MSSGQHRVHPVNEDFDGDNLSTWCSETDPLDHEAQGLHSGVSVAVAGWQ